MSRAAKQIVDRVMNREKTPCWAGGFEPTPLVLSVASGLMRDFGSVVEALALAVIDAQQKLPTRRTGAAQFMSLRSCLVLRYKSAFGRAFTIGDYLFSKKCDGLCHRKYYPKPQKCPNTNQLHNSAHGGALIG